MGLSRERDIPGLHAGAGAAPGHLFPVPRWVGMLLPLQCPEDSGDTPGTAGTAEARPWVTPRTPALGAGGISGSPESSPPVSGLPGWGVRRGGGGRTLQHPGQQRRDGQRRRRDTRSLPAPLGNCPPPRENGPLPQARRCPVPALPAQTASGSLPRLPGPSSFPARAKCRLSRARCPPAPACFLRPNWPPAHPRSHRPPTPASPPPPDRQTDTPLHTHPR